MDTVKFSVEKIGDGNGWYYAIRGLDEPRRFRRNYDDGNTDIENGDCVLKVRKANQEAGPFGKLIIDNPAKVYRDYDYFSVRKPGFYIYRNLRRKTKDFSVILFAKTGTYYSGDIYNKVYNWGDNYSEHGIFGKHELFTGEDFEKSSLKSCIPIGCGITPDRLISSEFGKKLYDELMTALVGEEAIVVQPDEDVEIAIDEDACIFNGCRIIFSTEDSLVSLKGDLTFENFSFPNTDGSSTSDIYYRLANLSSRRGPRKKFPHWDRDERWVMEYYFYNDKTGEIIWDDAINDEFAAFCAGKNKLINKSLKEFLGDREDKKLTQGVKKLIRLSGPTAFKAKINEHFRKNGLLQHEVVDVWPALMAGQWTYHDFDKGLSTNNQTLDEGYYLIVNYKGKQIIGPESSNTFTYVCVKEEKRKKRIRLIHSSRCQHVTAWSGGTTDQQYDHWNITDWLTGPMAEEAKLKIEEFPAVFMGNKISKNRKQKALDNLRARLRRINA